VSYDSATQSITLFSPWGSNGGLITLNWSQIVVNFVSFDQTL
jgi:hypothetical protein